MDLTPRYVSYDHQPIRFWTADNGQLRSEVVPFGMATTFPSHNEAYLRAYMQWGDNGLEHVMFVQVGVPPSAAKRQVQSLKSNVQSQKELI